LLPFGSEYFIFLSEDYIYKVSKSLPQQSEVAQGVPGRLRPRIFLTFRHYEAGRSSAKRTGRIYPGEIPGTHFQRLIRPQGTWFCRGYNKKIPSDTTGNRLVAQRLNHYATPGPKLYKMRCFLLVCVVMKCYVTSREKYKLRVFQIGC